MPAGSRGTGRGSCPGTTPPRSARSRRGSSSRACGRSPRTRRSSPGPARWSGTGHRRRPWSPLSAPHRGGCPAHRRRSRRSSPRRGRRGRPSAGRRSPRWPCPSRSPRSRRQACAAAAWSVARPARSGSDPGAGPCCTCTPAKPDAACPRGSWRTCVRPRRAAPRSRSCTRRGCTRSAARFQGWSSWSPHVGGWRSDASGRIHGSHRVSRSRSISAATSSSGATSPRARHRTIAPSMAATMSVASRSARDGA